MRRAGKGLLDGAEGGRASERADGGGDGVSRADNSPERRREHCQR